MNSNTKKALLLFAFILSLFSAKAQFQTALETDANEDINNIIGRNSRTTSDSIQGQHKQIPRGMTVWTLDPISGDRYEAIPDTTWYMRQNYCFGEGLQGEYNTLGNNGTPRINRIFTDRRRTSDFLFIDGFDNIITRPENFHFTNTFSPITNLQYNTCGNNQDGEDNFRTVFAVNAGKRIGIGFKFNYLYDRGYYDNQHTSHFGYTMWGSYLGDQYQAHLLMSLNHQKTAENGGIQNDDYITHPELYSQTFSTQEIPTQLQSNFNRNDNQHIFFNHKYSLGFSRKVPMTEQEKKAKKFAMESSKEKADQERKEKLGIKDNDSSFHGRNTSDGNTATLGRPKDAIIAGDEADLTKPKSESERIIVDSQEKADSLLAEEKKKKEEEMWMKTEYVPVTSFFHTLEIDNYTRSYISENTPTGYYANNYYPTATDELFTDETKLLQMRNTLGVALLEGFNKYAAFGLKGFASHYIQKYKMPDVNNLLQTTTENSISVGAQLSRQQGKALHFNATGEFFVVGEKAGQVDIKGRTELKFPLMGDSIKLALAGGYSLMTPSHYLRSYHSRHFWWDNDLNKEGHARIEGVFSLPRTGTSLRVAYDNFTNYTYLATSYTIDASYKQQGTVLAPRQLSSNLSIFTAQLMQNFQFGIFHLDNTLTYQKSSHEVVAAVPAINIYSALYLRFKIARVLDCDFGADVRFFTNYYAPEYSPQMESYVVQENADRQVKVGNYPYVNAFLNFQLKYCRFFVMFSHVNCGSGGQYFLTPHHPMNERVLRFGVNWNFFN